MRGENETAKQPSPSTYPEMYEGMSIRSAGVLAASTHRLLKSLCFRSQPLAHCLSRYGVNLSRDDFPRYHPRASARRRSGSTDISRYGLAFHLPDKEFRYLRTVNFCYSRIAVALRWLDLIPALTVAREIGLSHPWPREGHRVRRIVSEDSSCEVFPADCLRPSHCHPYG